MRQLLKKYLPSTSSANTATITAEVTGRDVTILNPPIKAELRRMFALIPAKEPQHLQTRQARTLSYSYVIYKFLQLLGYHELLQHFSLLKSRTTGRRIASGKNM